MGEYYGGYSGDTRSLDYCSYSADITLMQEGSPHSISPYPIGVIGRFAGPGHQRFACCRRCAGAVFPMSG